MSVKSLEVSPSGPLNFTKINNTQEIIVRNISKKSVTYKLQSTVHGKFSIRPRWGVLKPMEHSHILITLCKDVELSRKDRDKILVVCMAAPINAVDFDMTSSFWRHNICYDPSIEKHQLTCRQVDGAAGDGGAKDPDKDDLRTRRGIFTSIPSIRTPSRFWR
ncbi:uncharacterized protein LOC108089720 [Drosophila ficusphila]|uniref:uncharacterized protein LOC108089720 n=1 Tax=Drosophila ficusphila TaxID=30025 RepID=UPI0007E5E112|nr:uncharacterized protein LOC108089720 [Drosophila ficusphila]